jgi:hypothetical protein
VGKSKQPQLTALALALTAALGAMAPTTAKADQTISAANGPITISSGTADNITLISGGTLTGGMAINNSGTIGTLGNGGTISGISDGIVNNINGTDRHTQ